MGALRYYLEKEDVVLFEPMWADSDAGPPRLAGNPNSRPLYFGTSPIVGVMAAQIHVPVAVSHCATSLLPHCPDTWTVLLDKL